MINNNYGGPSGLPISPPSSAKQEEEKDKILDQATKERVDLALKNAQTGNTKPAEEIVEEKSGGFGAGVSAGMERLSAVGNILKSRLTDLPEQEEYSRYYESKARKDLKAYEEKAADLNLLGQAGNIVTQALPTVAAMATGTAAPVAAGLIGAGQTFGETVATGIEEGKDVSSLDAGKAALGTGIIDATLGGLPVSKLATAGRRIAADAGIGAVSGAQQQVGQNLALDKDATENIGVAALGGGLAGGGLSGVTEGVKFAKAHPRGADAAGVVRKVNDNPNNPFSPTDDFKTQVVDYANREGEIQDRLFNAESEEEFNLILDELLDHELENGYGASVAEAFHDLGESGTALTAAATRFDADHLTKGPESTLGKVYDIMGIGAKRADAAGKKNEQDKSVGMGIDKRQKKGWTPESHKRDVKYPGEVAQNKIIKHHEDNYSKVHDHYENIKHDPSYSQEYKDDYKDLVADLMTYKSLMTAISKGAPKGQDAVLTAKRIYQKAYRRGILQELSGANGYFNPVADAMRLKSMRQALKAEYQGIDEGNPNVDKELEGKGPLSASDIAIGGFAPPLLAAKKAAEIAVNNISGGLRSRGFKKRLKEGQDLVSGFSGLVRPPKTPVKPGVVSESDVFNADGTLKTPTVDQALQSGDLEATSAAAEQELRSSGIPVDPIAQEPIVVTEEVVKRSPDLGMSKTPSVPKADVEPDPVIEEVAEVTVEPESEAKPRERFTYTKTPSEKTVEQVEAEDAAAVDAEIDLNTAASDISENKVDLDGLKALAKKHFSNLTSDNAKKVADNLEQRADQIEEAVKNMPDLDLATKASAITRSRVLANAAKAEAKAKKAAQDAEDAAQAAQAAAEHEANAKAEAAMQTTRMSRTPKKAKGEKELTASEINSATKVVEDIQEIVVDVDTHPSVEDIVSFAKNSMVDLKPAQVETIHNTLDTKISEVEEVIKEATEEAKKGGPAINSDQLAHANAIVERGRAAKQAAAEALEEAKERERLELEAEQAKEAGKSSPKPKTETKKPSSKIPTSTPPKSTPKAEPEVKAAPEEVKAKESNPLPVTAPLQEVVDAIEAVPPSRRDQTLASRLDRVRTEIDNIKKVTEKLSVQEEVSPSYVEQVLKASGIDTNDREFSNKLKKAIKAQKAKDASEANTNINNALDASVSKAREKLATASEKLKNKLLEAMSKIQKSKASEMTPEDKNNKISSNNQVISDFAKEYGIPEELVNQGYFEAGVTKKDLFDPLKVKAKIVAVFNKKTKEDAAATRKKLLEEKADAEQAAKDQAAQEKADLEKAIQGVNRKIADLEVERLKEINLRDTKKNNTPEIRANAALRVKEIDKELEQLNKDSDYHKDRIKVVDRAIKDAEGLIKAATAKKASDDLKADLDREKAQKLEDDMEAIVGQRDSAVKYMVGKGFPEDLALEYLEPKFAYRKEPFSLGELGTLETQIKREVADYKKNLETLAKEAESKGKLAEEELINIESEGVKAGEEMAEELDNSDNLSVILNSLVDKMADTIAEDQASFASLKGMLEGLTSRTEMMQDMLGAKEVKTVKAFNDAIAEIDSLSKQYPGEDNRDLWLTAESYKKVLNAATDGKLTSNNYGRAAKLLRSVASGKYGSIAKDGVDAYSRSLIRKMAKERGLPEPKFSDVDESPMDAAHSAIMNQLAKMNDLSGSDSVFGDAKNKSRDAANDDDDKPTPPTTPPSGGGKKPAPKNTSAAPKKKKVLKPKRADNPNQGSFDFSDNTVAPKGASVSGAKVDPNQTFYHGTFAEFDKFQPSEMTGGLIYFSPSEDIAREYVTPGGRKNWTNQARADEGSALNVLESKIKNTVKLPKLKTEIARLLKDAKLSVANKKKIKDVLSSEGFSKSSLEDAISEIREDLGKGGQVKAVKLKADKVAGSPENPIHWRDAEDAARSGKYQKEGIEAVYVTEPGKEGSGEWAIAVLDPDAISIQQPKATEKMESGKLMDAVPASAEASSKNPKSEVKTEDSKRSVKEGALVDSVPKTENEEIGDLVGEFLDEYPMNSLDRRSYSLPPEELDKWGGVVRSIGKKIKDIKSPPSMPNIVKRFEGNLIDKVSTKASIDDQIKKLRDNIVRLDDELKDLDRDIDRMREKLSYPSVRQNAQNVHDYLSEVKHFLYSLQYRANRFKVLQNANDKMFELNKKKRAAEEVNAIAKSSQKTIADYLKKSKSLEAAEDDYDDKVITDSSGKVLNSSVEKRLKTKVEAARKKSKEASSNLERMYASFRQAGGSNEDWDEQVLSKFGAGYADTFSGEVLESDFGYES